MEKNRLGTLRRLLRAFDLPEEIDLTVPKFTMLGSTDLLIENHRGILSYSDTSVRLMTAEGVVCVTGQRLELTEFGSERIYLTGRVTGWYLEGENGCGNSQAGVL